MATNQDQRPRYYEDQYLGADDLEQAVAYGQIQQARHSLGAHTWGISIGLDLVEKPRAGANRVDVFVTPGYAWDGYGRPIVVLAPAPVPESLFADIKFDPQNADHRDGKGSLIKVWLQYDERRLRTPARGFESCNEGDSNSRIQESFRIVIGERGKAEQRGSVLINGTPTDPLDAVSRFEVFAAPSGGGSAPATGRKLWDESVPQQEFPRADPPSLWLIPIGCVRWLPVQNGLGHFVKRDDAGPSAQDPAKVPDADVIRRLRRYAGVVTEAIEGAGGVIRLRDRFKDPGAANFRPPVITTDPNKPPENELVWVEGDLRVVGDARLAGGKLAFRAADGKDEGTALEIRRSGGQQGGQGNRMLQVIIGPDGQDTNRLAVGRLKPDQSVDQKLVVTSAGNVGIGTDTPSQKLTIQSSFGTALEITPTSASLPWKSDGTLNEGAFVINQQSAGSQKGDADFALMRDRKQRVILGDTDTYISSQDRGAQKGQLRFFLNREEAGEKEVMRIDQLGNVGIGTVAPVATLQIDGDVALQSRPGGAARALPQNATLMWNDGKWLRLNQNLDFSKPVFGVHTPGVFAPGSLNVGGAGNWGDPGGGNVWITGRVGVGTTGPAGRIDIDESGALAGSRLKIGHAVAGHAHHITSFRDMVLNANNGIYIRHNPTAGDPTSITELVRITSAGNVGIGTTSPGYKLHVNGSAAKPGGGSWTNSSDQKLKKNIEPLKGALKKLTGLRGVVFEWKQPEKQGNLTGKQIGLIAQEVEKIFPEWVGTDAEGYKDLTVRGFEALTVESFKEVKQELDELKSAIKRSREKANRGGKGRVKKKGVTAQPESKKGAV